MQKLILFIIAGLFVMTTACAPDDGADVKLPPVADFTFEFITPNNVRFTNTTSENTFIVNWDFGNFGTAEGDVVEKSFSATGDYDVTLTVFGEGGSSSITKQITITQIGSVNCNGPLEFITKCGTRTWKLNPDEGALWVGNGANTLWQNGVNDVISRACDWNDEYIFSETGAYQYKSNGDVWGEGYMGFSTDNCYPVGNLSSDRAAWGDGTHTFEVIDGTPAKLKVIGNGAFVGLRKPGNGMEVSTPQSEVTYDIIDMRTEGGKDILELEVDYGTGQWRITLYAL